MPLGLKDYSLCLEKGHKNSNFFILGILKYS